MDDLDFSNDLFLKKVTGFKQQIDSRLNFCRDGLQLTVDHISFVEQKREIEKLRIEKEFEKTRLQILYILDKRKKKLLTSLDQEINKKRQLLLNRVQIYQNHIIQAADLKPELEKLEKYELNNNKHIIYDSPKKKRPPRPKNKPPPPPSPHQDDFVSIPSPSLHNYDSHSFEIDDDDDKEMKNGNINNNDQDKENKYEPTILSKKRLMLELEKYLFDKPPSPHKPRIEAEINRNKFIIDLESKFGKYGNISSSTGSTILDIQGSINTGVSWVVNKTNPLVSFGSMIANGFKKKQEIKELKFIPPPLLVVHLDGIEKALAEQFAECLTFGFRSDGLIISVINNNDKKSIEKFLDPSSIGATKKTEQYNVEQQYDNNNNDDGDELSHTTHRTILRVCILLYSSNIHSTQIINDLVEIYENKYNLKSICGVELTKVTNKPQSKSDDEDIPNCYVGNIFYDKEDGIVQGQDSIFESIINSTFMTDFDEEDDMFDA